jgi:hypothetical protein
MPLKVSVIIPVDNPGEYLNPCVLPERATSASGRGAAAPLIRRKAN